MANKIKFGLSNVVYAKVTATTDNSYTYDEPVSIPGAVNLSLSPVGDTNDFFADNVIYYSQTANQGYEGTLEIALLPESFLTDVMGVKKDSNGALVEDANTLPSNFALGFQVNGDSKNRRTWLYNCTAARPNQDASTKESGITPSTESLSIKAMPRLSDTAVKATMELNETNATAYNGFFNSVYEKSSTL